METIIRLKPDELTPDFVERIKAFFASAEEIEIAVTPVTDFGLNKTESKAEYKKRVNKAIKNLESNRDTVVLSEEEFNSLTDELLSE